MPPASDALPVIRSELRLIGRRRDASGTEIGIVYDPLRHRFFELGPQAIDILLHWRTGSRAKLAEQTRATPDHIDLMLRFLSANQLLRAAPQSPGHSWFGRIEAIIGKLFFFRVPLVHPDRLLDLLADLLAPLLGRAAITGFVVMAFAALILVIRQWDLFTAGFRPVFNAGNTLSLLVAVVLAKALHEIGHALAAKRLGCSVPAMGVAVMFGAPLLYTDLSDTWRLARRRDRLLVAAGGILAEMALAAFATWGWLILPDGPARGACFFLAGIAWTATLVINLNPFLRFDGYFMLSDLLGIPNLQERSFAQGRRVLRRLLWGIAEPAAEDLSPRLVAKLVAYAYSTWIFRAGLYLGLAWTVFQFLPKVAAIPLLVAELWVLLMRPIVRELVEWWRHKALLLRNRHSRVTLALAAGFCLWLAVPQRFDLALPAIQAPAERQWVHPPRPAQLISHLPEGTEVQAGEIVALFRDEDLDHRLVQSRLRLAILESTERQAARNQRSARELAVLRERIASETAALSGLLAQQEGLTIRAPFAGRVVESATGLRDGAWHATAEPLFLLIANAGPTISAFVDDRDLALVAPYGSASFHPVAIDFPVVSAEVARVEAIPAETITEPLLASINGGPIATEKDGLGRAIPRQGHYRVSATPRAGAVAHSGNAISGTLIVESVPYSLLGLALRRLQALLIREASA